MAEWRDIKGFEGLYQCSDEGEVRGVERLMGPAKGDKPRIKKSVKLKLVDHKGYLQVRLYKNGKQHSYLVHRLIAETFLPNDDPTKEVNHINECKSDNRVSNLEWISHIENVNHATCQERKVKNNKRTCEVIQISKDGNVLNEYDSIREAGRITNISNQSISACVNGKRKTAGGYLWIKKSYKQAS